MYLKKINKKNPDRVYLIIAESFRDKDTKKTKSRTIQSLGYLDELEKDFDDPIAYFKGVVEEMNNEVHLKKAPIKILFDSQEQLSMGTNNRKNFGYAPFVYDTLKVPL